MEEQLPVLLYALKTSKAQAQWAAKEEGRRDGIRKARWEEVKQEALTKLACKRSARCLRDELARRDACSFHPRVTPSWLQTCSCHRRKSPSG